MNSLSLLAVLAKGLHAKRLLDQRLDADLVVVGFIFVGALARRAAAPDAGDGRPLVLLVHAVLLFSRDIVPARQPG